MPQIAAESAGRVAEVFVARLGDAPAEQEAEQQPAAKGRGDGGRCGLEDADRALTEMKHSRTDGTPVLMLGA